MHILGWRAAIIVRFLQWKLASAAISGTPICAHLMGRPDHGDCGTLIEELYHRWPGDPFQLEEGETSRMFWVPELSQIPSWATPEEKDVFHRRELPLISGYFQGLAMLLGFTSYSWVTTNTTI